MELREKLGPLVFSSALVLGGVACTGENPSPELTNKTTSSIDQVEDPEINPEYTYHDLAEAVKRIEFLSDAEEFATFSDGYGLHEHAEENARNFLANKSIAFEAHGFNKENSWLAKEVTLAETLGVIPCAIVRASGLNEVIVTHENNRIKQPTYKGGRAEISHDYQITEVIAAMIIDELPHYSQIVSQFKRITLEAGANYDPSYKEVYGEDYTFPPAYEAIFQDQYSILNPRNELIKIFASRLSGWALVETDNTALGQKSKIVDAILERVVPHWQELKKFTGILSVYGNHGLHPHDNSVRIPELLNKVNAASTEVEEKKILEDDFNKMNSQQVAKNIKLPKATEHDIACDQTYSEIEVEDLV